MSRIKGLLTFGLVFVAVFVFYGNKASAATVYDGETHSPSSNRPTCVDPSLPVDFTAYISSVTLDISSGTVSYNVGLGWKNCNGDSETTRAYAIYASSEICPLAGWYGVGHTNAYDCVKYIGNPAYEGPGNGLTCAGGAVNGACVTSLFSGVRKTEQGPSSINLAVIPMSYTIPDWSSKKLSSGSYDISSSMCQYYKTGNNFETNNDNRCLTISITVSWEYNSASTVDGEVLSPNCSSQPFLRGWAKDSDNNTSLLINVYMDGPEGSGELIASKVNANKSGVPGVAGSKDKYQFDIYIYDYIANRNRDFYIYARDEGLGGGGVGWVKIGRISNAGPCNSKPTGSVTGNCNTLTIEAEDTDHTKAIDITIYKNGSKIGSGSTNAGSGTRTMTFDIKSYKDFNPNEFVIKAKDIDKTVNASRKDYYPDYGEVKIDSKTVGPCAKATCGNIKRNPSDPEPGEIFSISLSINVNDGIGDNGSDAPYTAKLQYVDGLNNTTPQDKSQTIDPGDNNSTVVFTSISANDPLHKSITITITGLGNAFDCADTITVANQPYLSFYGNDVFAGGGFTGACDTAGKIEARLRSDNAGAGAQLAVFALGTIENFTSAKLRHNLPPVNPTKGLSFANTSDPPGTFGGSNCVSGYDIPSDLSPYTNIPGNTMNLNGHDSGVYYNLGGNLNVSGTVGAGKHITVYVKGDLVVTGDIRFENVHSWGGIDNIPTLKFIVEGNIYISNTVTRINGIYVARPQDPTDSTRGTIYTCTSGSSTWTDDELYDNCANQLTVYGNLVAKKIKWLRTFKTLNNADPYEQPYSGTFPNAAEVIISGPEMYINQHYKITDNEEESKGTKYDSISQMPPII